MEIPSLSKPKVLLIEDDTTLAPLVCQYLEDQSFETRWSETGDNGLTMFGAFNPDLVILDLMLPGMDGLAVCQEIRRVSQAAILILTAKGDESDRVLGLELGADDYMTKPFGLKELVARIRAILRRYRPESAVPRPLARQFGRFSLDITKRILFKDNQPIELTRSEFDILELLSANPDQVFSRDDLLDRVKGGDTEAFDRAVDTHISNLRKKIEDDPKTPKYIKTVWGVGYRFTP